MVFLDWRGEKNSRREKWTKEKRKSTPTTWFPPFPSLYLWGVARSFRRIFQSALLNERTEESRRKRREKKKKQKKNLPLFSSCSLSSLSSTPHYNTAFAVVSASNLHVTRRVESDERRHWLRGRPVGGASTPHGLSASRRRKRGRNTMKKRQFWRNASLEELQFFVLNFCSKFSSFFFSFRFMNVNHVFEADATRDSSRPWRSKHGSVSFLFLCVSLAFIYTFFSLSEMK